MDGTVPAFVQPHGLYCPSLPRHFKRHCLLLAMPLCINQFKMFMSLQSNLSINAAAPEDLLWRHEKWELGSSESANVR